MDKKNVPMYDAVVVFDVPVEIANDRGERIYIFGLLYDKTLKHKDDLWTWELNRYLCYLQGCQTVQTNNGKLAPELWITPDEQLIALKVETKNYIYRIMRERMQGYGLSSMTNRWNSNPKNTRTCSSSPKTPLSAITLRTTRTRKRTSKPMRTKLTEIISTMNQYNGMRAHRDKYQGGEQIDIQTEMPGAPQHATIQEGMQTPAVLEMLHEEDPQEESQPRLCEPNDRILRFEEFVHECYIREVSDDTDSSEEDDEKEEE